jgi:hypothetical protein
VWRQGRHRDCTGGLQLVGNEAGLGEEILASLTRTGAECDQHTSGVSFLWCGLFCLNIEVA